MLNVALTGNIASGKSTVANWFADWGATVIDADELVLDIERPGSPTLAAIARRFGADVIGPDGELDRALLRRRVFGDRAALGDLNAIVHPEVHRRRDALAAEAAARGDCVVVNDIPLLFEVMDPKAFDLVVLVDAPVEVRRVRLVTQRGLPGDEADRLLASQLPADEKRARSDIVLDNARSLDDLRRAAWSAWRTIRERAATKLAGGGSGALLAVLAHPGDEAFHVGGTLARYADAGVALYLACTALEGGTVPEPLQHAARTLRIREVHRVPGDPRHASARTAALMRRLKVGVVVSVNGSAAAALARESWHQAGRPGRLFYATIPEDIRAAPDLGVAARLDVRPWRDVKREAMAAYGEMPCAIDPAGRLEQLTAYEWYLTDPPPTPLLGDLYAGRSTHLDTSKRDP